MAAEQAFTWGFGGQKITTPEQAKRVRDVAEALNRRAPSENWTQGLAGIAGALSSNVLNDRAATAETEGQQRAGGLFANLATNTDPNNIIAALTSPDAAWASPAQSQIASALLNQGLERSDPAYQLDMDYKRAQLADLQTPDQQALVNTPNGIYDPNNKSWISPPGATEGGMLPPDADAESKLRTEYNGINTVKDFGLQTQAYQRVLDSAKDPSPSGDLALIFNFMKVLDPGSTVREGEFATAQNAGSLPEQVMSQYNKVLSGERLVPEIRKDFVQRAGQLYQGAAQLQQGTNQRYDNLATQYGMDPNRITADVPQIGVLNPQFNLDQYLNPQTGQQTQPYPVTNDAEFDAIPSGSYFKAPDGTVRQKP